MRGSQYISVIWWCDLAEEHVYCKMLHDPVVLAREIQVATYFLVN